MSRALVTVELELEADTEQLVNVIERFEIAVRAYLEYKLTVHSCKVSTRNTFKFHDDDVALLSGNLIPHRAELNTPGNIGCICLACVQSRRASRPDASESGPETASPTERHGRNFDPEAGDPPEHKAAKKAKG